MSPDLSPRARHRLRRAGRAALIVAAVLALGWLAAGLLFQGLLDRDRLARWSEARLEASLDRDVELREVRLSAFPRPTVELMGLRIGNPPAFDAPPFARVRRVRLRVALWPLFRRRAVVEEARLRGAALHLAVLGDGRSNYGDFSPAGGAEPRSGTPPLHLRIEEVRLEEGSLVYHRTATGLRVEADRVSGRARLAAGEDGRGLHVEASAGQVRAGGLPGGRTLAPAPARLVMEGRLPGGGGLTVDRGRLELAEVGVRVSGRVDSVARPTRRVELRVAADTVEMADVAALVRRLEGRAAGDGDGGPDDTPGLEGRLSVDLGVRGRWGPEHRPTVGGQLRLREGRVGSVDRPPAARELAAEARVDGDSVILDRLRGRLLGGELEAGGALRLDSAQSWRLRLRARPRASRLAASRGADTVGLEGAVAADLALRGRGADPASIRAVGMLRAAGLAVTRPGWSASLRLPGGTVRLAGDSAVAEALPVVAAGDTLRLDLGVEGVPARLLRNGPVPTFRAALRGDRLDLDALLGPTDEEQVGRTRLALARLGGRTVAGRSPERLAAGRAGLPDSVAASGTLQVELGELIRRPRQLTDLSARLELSPGRLAVADAVFGLLGGSARTSGELALGPGPAPFRLRIQAEELAAGDLLTTSTPVGRLVTGRAELALEASGRLDSLLLPLAGGLGGEGRLTFEEGRMRSNPVTAILADVLRAPALRSPGFRRWEQPFTLGGDTLVLAPSAPEGLPVPLRLGGTLGLDGRLGLAVTGEVSTSTARALADRAGGVPGALLERASGAGTLPVALRLAGTVDSPRVNVDAAALREALEAAGRREAGEAARRGAGALLRRLLEEPGAPPADTAEARPDTAGAQPDTAGARSDTAGARPDTAGTTPGGGS